MNNKRETDFEHVYSAQLKEQ